ncbi:MAG: hypothetical protein H6540_05785 [Bacteroidales bacterium]|nr:hypothetical protein [Bacteroidales bacterium]
MVFVLVLLPVGGIIISPDRKHCVLLPYRQKETGTYVGFEETLRGLRIVKAFNAEEKMQSRFEKHQQLFTPAGKIFSRQQLASPGEFLQDTGLW